MLGTVTILNDIPTPFLCHRRQCKTHPPNVDLLVDALEYLKYIISTGTVIQLCFIQHCTGEGGFGSSSEPLIIAIASELPYEIVSLNKVFSMELFELFISLFISSSQYEDAVDKYREAIQSSTAHKDMFRTDLLQVCMFCC